MNRVFVTQDVTHRIRRDARAPKFDFTPAERFGRLVTLAPTTRGRFELAPFEERIRSLLADFDVEDYLLPIGDPVLVCVAAVYAALATGGEIKVLKWIRPIDVWTKTVVTFAMFSTTNATGSSFSFV